MNEVRGKSLSSDERKLILKDRGEQIDFQSSSTSTRKWTLKWTTYGEVILIKAESESLYSNILNHTKVTSFVYNDGQFASLHSSRTKILLIYTRNKHFQKSLAISTHDKVQKPQQQIRASSFRNSSQKHSPLSYTPYTHKSNIPCRVNYRAYAYELMTIHDLSSSCRGGDTGLILREPLNYAATAAASCHLHPEENQWCRAV